MKVAGAAVPDANLLVAASGDDPPALLVDHNITDEVRVRKCGVGFPAILADEVFGCLVCGGGPEVTVIVEKVFVHRGFVDEDGGG